jgi:hypothetical protein
VRIPVRSETDAFRLACGVAFVGGVSLLIGAYTDAAVGIVLFVLIALLWLLRQWNAEQPTRLRDAALDGHHAGAPHRILIVAGAAPPSDALLERLRRSPGPAPVVEVLAPVLQSRTHFVTTDIDPETEDARRRLRETLRWARVRGIEATGKVGDPIDPFAGLADELRRYDVDEVIIAGHRPDHVNWVEHGMLERLRAELDVPVTMTVVEADRPLAVGSASAAGFQ